MKLLHSLGLMAALAGGTLTLATAQTPDKPKTTPDDSKKSPEKKADDKKAAGKIEIYEWKKGWRFRIKNSSDVSIACSTTSYEKKEDMLKELELIKSLLNSAKPVEVKE